MPPRKRNRENRPLPARWRHKNGAYYYRVPPGLEYLWDGKQDFRLGKTLPEAHRTWAQRVESREEIRNIGELLDRYAAEYVPTKAPKTQASYTAAIGRLRPVFASQRLQDLEPQDVYRYVDRRGAPTAALREVEVLRHSFTKAVEWGLLRANPLMGNLNFRGRTPPPRDRYIEDWEIVEALRLPSKRKRGSVLAIQAFIALALLTGLRRGDILRLRMDQLAEDGIHVQPRKTANTTGRRIVIEWNAQLRMAKSWAVQARPVDIGPWLFCTRHGDPYIDDEGKTSGWDSMWQRFMARVLAETDVAERFTQHDLRAKCGSDAESLEHARELLTHADPRTTQRSYRRRPAVVKPGKWSGNRS